jgi:hypothetical protein
MCYELAASNTHFVDLASIGAYNTIDVPGLQYILIYFSVDIFLIPSLYIFLGKQEGAGPYCACIINVQVFTSEVMIQRR